MRSKDDVFKYNGGGNPDEPGPVVTKLLEQLKGIQLGKIKDPFGWVEEVREYRGNEYEVGGAEKEVNGHVVG